eukprot:gene5853-8964_t
MSQWQERFAAQYKRYVQSLLQPGGPGGLCPLDAEFKELMEVDWDMEDKPGEFVTGNQPVNQPKNRNPKVLPNEHTKITLASLGPNDNTYINANYIDGKRLFNLPFNYIATQAPMEGTVGDFWRLVAECGVKFIVMLTTEENSATYWPQHTERMMRPRQSYTVRLVKATRTNDVITRDLILVNSDTRMTRNITQFQYVGWRDEVPRTTLGLMDIILTLGKCNASIEDPILVHCGAGVGRTGVFIGMHVCLALFSLEKELNVKEVVRILKYQRTGMVKTKLQYQFLVCALNLEFQRMVLKHQQQYRSGQGGPPRSPLLGPSSRGRVSPVGSESATVAPLKAVPSHFFGNDGKFDPAAAYGSRPPSPEDFGPPLYGTNPIPSGAIPPISQPPLVPAFAALLDEYRSTGTPPKGRPTRSHSMGGPSGHTSVGRTSPLPPIVQQEPAPESGAAGGHSASGSAADDARRRSFSAGDRPFLMADPPPPQVYAQYPAQLPPAPPMDFRSSVYARDQDRYNVPHQPVANVAASPVNSFLDPSSRPATPGRGGDRVVMSAGAPPPKPDGGNAFAQRIHDAVYGSNPRRSSDHSFGFEPAPPVAAASPRRPRADELSLLRSKSPILRASSPLGPAQPNTSAFGNSAFNAPPHANTGQFPLFPVNSALSSGGSIPTYNSTQPAHVPNSQRETVLN